jgi:hypothetical protein
VKLMGLSSTRHLELLAMALEERCHLVGLVDLDLWLGLVELLLVELLLALEAVDLLVALLLVLEAVDRLVALLLVLEAVDRLVALLLGLVVVPVFEVLEVLVLLAELEQLEPLLVLVVESHLDHSVVLVDSRLEVLSSVLVLRLVVLVDGKLADPLWL